MNNDKQIAWDTTVAPDPNSPRDSNGLATGYIQGANFGKPTGNGQFPAPISGDTGGRTIKMALGLRF